MALPRYTTLAVTSSGAVYAWTDSHLVRIKGYDIDVYALESGISASLGVGDYLNAIALRHGARSAGKDCGRVTSTRFKKVIRSRLGDGAFNGLPELEQSAVRLAWAASSVPIVLADRELVSK